MRAASERAGALAAVAGIRELQRHAREVDALRAVDAHHEAKERHDLCLDGLIETQAGWAEAVESGAFDPEVARHWFAALDQGYAEARRLEAQVEACRSELERARLLWQGAVARSEAAREQADAAAKRAARQREEVRLAALEDRALARMMRS